MSVRHDKQNEAVLRVTTYVCVSYTPRDHIGVRRVRFPHLAFEIIHISQRPPSVTSELAAGFDIDGRMGVGLKRWLDMFEKHLLDDFGADSDM